MGRGFCPAACHFSSSEAGFAHARLVWGTAAGIHTGNLDKLLQVVWNHGNADCGMGNADWGGWQKK
ncbi:MAG: hypothetical protein IPL28_14605 [Chloroflexi bacterium]|nr:hypothetical protein [Chloroflexota bacterium]